MTLPLPDADASRLQRSPLEAVVCQVRYETTLRASESHTALAVHEALGGAAGAYPNIEQIAGQSMNVVFGPGQQPTAEQKSLPGTWRFASRDGTWTVSMTPDFVALETTAYTTWADDFRERLAAVIDAVVQHVRPALNPRLGVRYIDRVSELELSSPSEWQPYIAPELLGPVLHPAFGEGVRQAQQQLLIELEEDTGCVLRHGFVQDSEQVDYFMDYDVFRQGGRAFDADDLKAAADVLNDYALRLFYATVQPALLERLK